ncbi:response regulator transcription factor [Vibrio metschnikovii]|nr:response regulator transcription factor [Vibrio metschnikovii]EKO3609986.1 response regulator transcription factor [Vibrio metschnikovii]EKO3682953.1 response regulator transcription factor [Vibrio metschnikovii]EKO3713243.1 response regulator transcription factor [Vibrio metschnikovii]EKO3738260.1 response regulator transcription factor [Vibrio metschnikovii]
MKNIVIVDDHPVVVMAMKIMLEKNGFHVTATTDNGVDALKLIREYRPDAVIMDIGIPQLDGLEVINRLNSLELSSKVLVLTAKPSEHFVTRCIQAGASGFVSKQQDLTEVLSALRAVLSGYTYFPNLTNIQRKQDLQLTETEKLAKLSGREMMVLQQLASGLSNKEIASHMLLSNKTISTYKTRLLEKLNARTLVDLIEIAQRNKII